MFQPLPASFRLHRACCRVSRPFNRGRAGLTMIRIGRASVANVHTRSLVGNYSTPTRWHTCCYGCCLSGNGKAGETRLLSPLGCSFLFLIFFKRLQASRSKFRVYISFMAMLTFCTSCTKSLHSFGMSFCSVKSLVGKVLSDVIDT